ncbi:MAG: LamG domain-containing protein [Alphaproteobacteria bacterium]|nr:LamG domain-containing protein [Alphaproteobacteria bacterium]
MPERMRGSWRILASRVQVRASSLAVLCLLGMVCLGIPTASAALCSNVFPQDATPDTGATLDLAVMDRQVYGPFPSRGAAYAAAGDYFYNAGQLNNGETISVTAGRPVRMFVDGDLELAPHSRINPNGSASDLLIVVRGNLSIGTKNDINALVYVTGDVTTNPSSHIEGALTAEGSIDTKVKDVITYDEVAASAFAQGDLCQTSENIPLYLRFDETSWGVPTNTGRGAFDIQVLGGAVTAGVDPAWPVDSQGEGTCRYGRFDAPGAGLLIDDQNALDLDRELSVSFWLKVESAPRGRVTLLAKGDTYRVELNSELKLVLSSRMPGWFGSSTETLSVASAPLSVGEWAHVGFTLKLRLIPLWIDALEGNLYVNGVRQSSGIRQFIFGVQPDDSAPLLIGADSTQGLAGAIDEVRLQQTIWSATVFQRQMAARHWCGTPAGIDHFEFTTSASAHTCSHQTVTLMACTNAGPGACQPYPGEVSVMLGGDGWLGGNQQTLRDGVGTFQLQGLQLQMPLVVEASEPDASRSTLCRIGDAPLSSDCILNFAQSGFIFDVPDMQADRGQANVAMRAVIDVGDEGSPRCEPAFTDSTREVRFWSSFVTPSVSELSDSSKPVQVNAEPVEQNFAEARSLALRFDQNGATSLDVNYAEAGQMLLNAYYPGGAEEGDSGPMSGSDDFVSTPAGFCIEPSRTCPAGDSSCDVFRKVGQAFSTAIRPVVWRADGDLCAAGTTRNYRQDQVQLRPVVLTPSPAIGGVAGRVLRPADSRYDHLPPGLPANWDGTVIQDLALSEVGVFRLRVEPTPYLGVAVPASESAPVGRFIPHYLKAKIEGALKAGCGVFSYQDQPVAVVTPPALTITGYGVADGVEYPTENYDFDGFWGFASSPTPSWLAVGGNPDLAPRLDHGKGIPEALTWQSIKDLAPSESGNNNGDGQRTYTWGADWLRYGLATQPDAADHPFQVLLRFTMQQLTDGDGVCNGSTCQEAEAVLDHSEFRLGRLRIGNGHGSELQDLSLPWVIETWQASNIFLPEGGDTCSASVWGNAQAFEQVGNLASKSPQIDGGQTGYEGSLVITKPEATGEARIGFPNVPEWLWYDWQGKGREASRGLASFGIYHGPKPLIFRREVYRGM